MMTKEEFLTGLRSSLSGSVSADVINENMRYYENFINTEIRKGRTEEDVLEELGSPLLIAKTVKDTASAEDRRMPGSNEASDLVDSENDVMPWWKIVAIIFAVMIGLYILINIAIVLVPVFLIAAAVLFVVKQMKRRE